MSLGVMRFINIAHGDIIVLFSFVPDVAFPLRSDGRPFITAIAMLPLAFGARLRDAAVTCSSASSGKSVLPIVLVTFGLSIIIQNGLLQNLWP